MAIDLFHDTWPHDQHNLQIAKGSTMELVLWRYILMLSTILDRWGGAT